MTKNNSLATMLFCAVILSAPIQWQRIANFGNITIASFHIFSLLFCFSILLNKEFMRSVKFSHIYVIGIAVFFYLFLLAVASIYDSSHYDIRDLIRQYFYVVTSFSVAIYLAATGFCFENVGKVIWFISLAPFLLVGLIWLAISDVRDPFNIFAMVIAHKDPDLLIRHVFGTAIRSGESNLNVVQASLRHQIVGAVLAGLFFNVAIFKANADLISKATRIFFFCSLALSVIIIAASMSRSIILSGIISYLIYFFFTVQFRLKSCLYIVATLLGCLALLFGPVGQVFYARVLGNTVSYAVRLDNSSSALESINNNIIFGRLSQTDSPHNLIIDFWMVFGLAGLFSSIFLISSIVIKSYLAAYIGYRKNNAILMMGCIAVNLPLIRWMTASRGQLSFPEWLCIGLVLACIMLRDSKNEQLMSTK